MVAVDDGIEKAELLPDGAAGGKIVVGTDRNARGTGVGNVLEIKGVDMIASLRGFNVDKLHASVMTDTVPVNNALVMRDVNTVVVHPAMPVVY